MYVFKLFLERFKKEQLFLVFLINLYVFYNNRRSIKYEHKKLQLIIKVNFLISEIDKIENIVKYSPKSIEAGIFEDLLITRNELKKMLISSDLNFKELSKIFEYLKETFLYFKAFKQYML